MSKENQKNKINRDQRIAIRLTEKRIKHNQKESRKDVDNIFGNDKTISSIWSLLQN